MIEIEKTETKDRRGIFQWHVRGRPEIWGTSREPLLDACRVLKSLGEAGTTRITTFKPGSTIPCVTTTIGYGAGRTVEAGSDGTPRFGKFRH